MQYVLILYTDEQCKYGMTLFIDREIDIFKEIQKRVSKSVGPRLTEEMVRKLGRGESVYLGSKIILQDEGVWMNLSYGQEFFAWSQLVAGIYKGDLIVADKRDKRNIVRVPCVETIDVEAAEILMAIATKEGYSRISEIL